MKVGVFLLSSGKSEIVNVGLKIDEGHVPRDLMKAFLYGEEEIASLSEFKEHIENCETCKKNLSLREAYMATRNPVCLMCPVKGCYDNPFLADDTFTDNDYYRNKYGDGRPTEKHYKFSPLFCKSPIICNNVNKGKEGYFRNVVCVCAGCEKPLLDAPCKGEPFLICPGPREKLCEGATLGERQRFR